MSKEALLSSSAPLLPLHIDSTMRSCFVSCPQKFYREFVQGYRPQGLSIDLHAGACFASALETVYREVHLAKRALPEALVTAHAGFLQQWGDVQVPEYKRTAKSLDRVWEAVEDYFKTYSPLTDHIQPYFTSEGKPTFEYTFAIPLEPAIEPLDFDPVSYDHWTGKAGTTFASGRAPSVEEALKGNFGTTTPMAAPFPMHPSGSPFLYCGRFDMLGSHDGRPVVRDEKTTGGSIGDRWAEQWNLRGQFLGYVWACQQCGLDLDSVVVRGVGIQKTQLRQIEAIKTYSNMLVSRWHEQLRRDLWRIRRAWDEGYWDFNFGESCTAYGNCIFMRVCESGSPEAWLNEFEVRRWNPLQKNPIEEKPDAKTS